MPKILIVLFFIINFNYILTNDNASIHNTIKNNKIDINKNTIIVDNKTIRYGFDKRCKSIADTLKINTAIIITAYNRPEYLKQCITSIEKNNDFNNYCFVFALDGGLGSKQIENIECILTSKISNIIILLRNYNYGCPKNHIDAKRFVFEWCKFHKAIILEDDVVISSYFFKFIDQLYAWANKKYNNIGAVQGWNRLCYMSEKDKYNNLNYIQENPFYWDFLVSCIDNKTWSKISQFLYTYENFIDQIPQENKLARSKPWRWKRSGEIKKWVRQLILKKQKTLNVLNTNQYHSKLKLKKTFLNDNFKPNQDVMMSVAFYLNNLVKLQPVVNRAITIGAHGLSNNNAKNNAPYLTKVKIHNFHEDISLFEFNLV